jgi:hypothetical protein
MFERLWPWSVTGPVYAGEDADGWTIELIGLRIPAASRWSR